MHIDTGDSLPGQLLDRLQYIVSIIDYSNGTIIDHLAI